MDTWEGIDEFVAIATTGSFSAGALALGLSRSHMSRAIARLEDRLNSQLFHRTTRTVRLSSSGRIFLSHCERLLRERAEALAIVREQGEPRGDLRITCSMALGERFVAPLARRYAMNYPDVTVHLDLSNQVIDIVSEGMDLAIRTGHLPTSDLIATKIASRQIHTCASPGYLERAGRPEKIEDLSSHECLVGSATVWHFADKDELRSYRPRPLWSCNSGQAVLHAALDSMGICQLPHFYVSESLENGRLCPILVEFDAPSEPIWAVYPEKRHVSPKVQRFVKLLKAELSAEIQHRGE